MADELTTRNGETVEIASVIEALERAPNKEEILEALKHLRQEKVKEALGDAVKAARFDREKVFSEFLADGEKAERTKETYQRECARFFSWCDREGLHLFQVERADVNRYKSYLTGRHAANTARLALAAASSFYSYLEAERYLDRTPFAHIRYPKKEYKKAVRPDQGSPVPVMSEEEYRVILETLEARATAQAKRIYERRKRDAARRLLPFVHVLGDYGLRLSDALTLRLEGEYFSYRQKGGEVRKRELAPATAEILRRYAGGRKEPFRTLPKATAQGALRRISVELARVGQIRYPYSAHDFRHAFALRLYRETHDVYRVKEALGHATVSVTEIYLVGLGALAR